jgi:hypothetical protein
MLWRGKRYIGLVRVGSLSLDEGEGVSFHTFTLPEDRCVRLLVKNLGRGTPESVVR